MPQTDPLAMVAGLEALEAKATTLPWYFHQEAARQVENAQCAVLAEEDETATSLFDTFNRGYKVSGVVEEIDEDQRNFYDERGEKDLKFVVELCNAFPQLKRAIRDLAGENERLRAALAERDK